MSNDVTKKIAQGYLDLSSRSEDINDVVDMKNQLHKLLGSDVFVGDKKLLHGEFYNASAKTDKDISNQNKEYTLDADALLSKQKIINDLYRGAGEKYDFTKPEEERSMVYPIHLSALRERKYDHNLEAIRKVLLKDEKDDIYYLAKDILHRRYGYLSFEDMLVLQLCLALDEDEKHKDRALILLEDMENYVGLLSPYRREKFLMSLLLLYIQKYTDDNDISTYEKGISYMDKLLNTLRSDDKKAYLQMLLTKTQYLLMGKQYNAFISLSKELLSESEKFEESDEFVRNIKADALERLGGLYMMQKKYKEAIENFTSCLKYKPDNEKEGIKKEIENLSKKKH